MKRQRITLLDIAQRVGVTKMTVSRYLRTPDKVAKETGEKIKLALDELGYVPSLAPTMMTNSATHTIGLAVSSFSNLLFSDLIEGVEERAKEYGYDVLISHTSYLADEEERKVSQLLSYQIDAMILCDSIHTASTVRRLKTAGIPVVEVMSLLPDPIDINIGYDHVKSSYASIKALIASGRKNIAYLRARLDSRTIDRQEGYEIACDEAGLQPYVYGSNVRSNFTRGAAMMRQAVQDIPNLDAVFCTNDDVAIGAMIACSEMGIKIPEQISVLGYNGLNIGATTIPKLNSVVTARKDMGCLAVDKIIKRLKGESTSNPIVELYPMLSFGDTLTFQEKRNISRLFDTMFAKPGPLPKLKRPLSPAIGD